MNLQKIKLKSKIKPEFIKPEFVKPEFIVTTFFGAGYFPKAPGTFASIIAFIPIIFLPDFARFFVLIFAVLLASIIAIPMISKVEKIAGNDASIIVIDEIIGVWLVFSSPFIPITWLSFLLGIGLFRFFDILKPSIIGKINEKKGAIYVILDDILASFATIILLHFTYFLLKFATFLRIINLF